MHSPASYLPHPSFLSYPHHHYAPIQPDSTYKPQQSDNEDDNQRLLKKPSRTIPVEEKDVIYYEKRARNNESAKRSRDTRRVKEQEIQERVHFLENENTRLSRENEAIRYQLSHLHALCHGLAKP